MALRASSVLLSLASVVPLDGFTLGRQLMETSNSASLSLSGSTSFRQVLHNYRKSDLEYIADVVVGNQALGAILDTGSFETLVFSALCSTCGDPENLYNSTQNPTFERGVLSATHYFGSGSAECVEGLERISVGPLVAPRISFWEVMVADMPVIKHSGFQAIVGVGPPGNPVELAWDQVRKDKRKLEAFKKRSARWPERFREAGLRELSKRYNESLAAAEYAETRNDSLLEALNVTSFSVCYGSSPGSEGYFTWHDDLPQRREELFVDVPIVGHHSWSAELTGVHLEGPSGVSANLSCSEGCGAIVDSGTSLLVMPRAAASSIAKELQKEGAACDERFGVTRLPSLRFQLGGRELSLPPEAYLGMLKGKLDREASKSFVIDTEAVVACGLQLIVMTQEAETQFGPLWILGMPFFRKYYVNFHVGSKGNRSLSIAPAGEGCLPSKDVALGQRAAQSVDAAGQLAPTALEGSHFRTIDASRLREPQWAAKALGRGKTVRV